MSNNIAGEVTDAIDGISMKVDFVRVYENPNLLGLHKTNVDKIKAYPNPLKDKLTFSGNKLTNLKVSIFNVQGKVVLKTILPSNEESIDVSKLKSGVYVLSTTGEGNFTEKHKLIKL